MFEIDGKLVSLDVIEKNFFCNLKVCKGHCCVQGSSGAPLTDEETLILDRIVSIEPLDVPFRANPEFDSEHFFDDVIGVSKNIGSTPRTIKFWATEEQSKYIETKPLHRSQQLIKQNADGSCVFKMDVVVNFELYSVFMSYGLGVKILSPRFVREHFQRKLKDTMELYDKMV